MYVTYDPTIYLFYITNLYIYIYKCIAISMYDFVIQYLKMNGEVSYEKVVERQFKGIHYIVTLRADNQGLSIEFENKFTGDVWECYYEPQYIEQITTKAGSHKKYNKFAQMIMRALPDNFVGDGCELFVDLLTHQDLQMQANRKNGNASKTTDPKLIHKRYLILSYISAYDKAHYPIPLDYISTPDPQRLKLTIRRLAQQVQCIQLNPKTDTIFKQLSAVKHENQLLKSKIKMKNQSTNNSSKENFSNNTVVKELQEENILLKEEISNIKTSKQQQINKKNRTIQQKDKKIQQLENKIKKYEQSNDQFEIYEQKFNQLSKQADEIASALQHSKQNQKKSQLKISNLEKQLQKMMAQIKKKTVSTTNNHMVNSPRKSDNGSVKSSGSKKSGTNKSTKQIAPAIKNSTIYDSDTQSSRMRRNNNQVSPYRQSSRPLNSSKSAKKREQQRANAMSKYSNISNLYNKNNTNRSRSRSKSRSVKRDISPPSDNFQSSAVMTEGVDYPSDNQQENKVSETMARLRSNRNKKLKQEKDKTRVSNKQKKNSLNPIQQKISSIASLMRTFRNNNNNSNNVEV